MESDNIYIREIERAEPVLSLKQCVYELLNDAIARDEASEGLWLVAVDENDAPTYHRRCYCRNTPEGLSRQMAYLPSNERRLVSVLAFDTDKVGAETEAMVLTLRLQAIEAEAGVEFLAHYVVTGKGESAWWRSATGVD